jgi:DNA-directed RNA polymerase specialized sigma24 family protein
VAIGRLDAQTIAWEWVAGTGQRRVYQRGYFALEDFPLPLDDGPSSPETGKVRWPWMDELEHREWSLRDESDGFESVAGNDGLRRYRPPTADDRLVTELINRTLAAMPGLQRAATTLVTLRGLSEREAAETLGVARSTTRRLAQKGVIELQAALIEAGYGPTRKRRSGTHAERHELAQAA